MGPGTGGPVSLIGREIAGYRIEEEKGSGSNGIVFRASRIGDDADKPPQVAIKILLPNVLLTTDMYNDLHARFLREAKILQQLKHRNIVSVLAFGEQDGLTYMVLPYLPNGTLGTRIAQGQINLSEADRYISQLASAIDYAHSLGIIHRDIKPQNVLIDDDGNALLADFGLVRELDKSRSQQSTGRFAVGTLPYMAPEQFSATKAGNAADIYSLGALAYELVTGRVPFDGEDSAEIVGKILSQPPERPKSIRSDLPEPAEAVIWQALAKKPDARFASATEMANAFAEGLQNRWYEGVNPINLPDQAFSQPGSLIFAVSDTATTLPPTPVTASPPERNWRHLVPALVAVAVLILISAVVLSRNSLGAPSTPGSSNIAQANTTATAGKTPHAPTATPKRSTGSRNNGNNGNSGNTGGKPAATATPTPRPTATPTPTPRPAPTATPIPPPSKTITIGWSGAHSTWIWMTFKGFPPATYTYSCNFSTPPQSNPFKITVSTSPQTWDSANTCWDAQHGDHVWVIVNGVWSNTLTVP